MDGQLTLRPAVASDAESIVSIVRRELAPAAPELSIMGCHGAVEFVAREIEAACPYGPGRFFLAEVRGTAVGVLELRLPIDHVFVNHVAIREGWRRRGIGTDLMRQGLQSLKGHIAGRRTIRLDVGVGNTSAMKWYHRLGFIRAQQSRWVELDASYPAAPFEVRGASQAAALLPLFGFAEIRVATARGEFVVGMLGQSWFRLSDGRAASDPGVWAAMRELGRERRVLLVERHPSAPAAGAQIELARFERLSGQLDLVLDRLQMASVR